MFRCVLEDRLRCGTARSSSMGFAKRYLGRDICERNLFRELFDVDMQLFTIRSLCRNICIVHFYMEFEPDSFLLGQNTERYEHAIDSQNKQFKPPETILGLPILRPAVLPWLAFLEACKLATMWRVDSDQA